MRTLILLIAGMLMMAPTAAADNETAPPANGSTSCDTHSVGPVDVIVCLELDTNHGELCLAVIADDGSGNFAITAPICGWASNQPAFSGFTLPVWACESGGNCVYFGVVGDGYGLGQCYYFVVVVHAAGTTVAVPVENSGGPCNPTPP